ncbi:GGDEF domain-containing protein [Vibrio lamellibrachiae]|uniref:GGDEF domain-containing protein n=1 Tax=Vibrio lamellibrachiae TaxID=2910253 RepID=UPI003D0B9264
MMKQAQTHILVLILLSITLIFVQFSSHRTISILDYSGITFNDGSLHSGFSTSNILKNDEQKLLFECQLVQVYQWPFCEYQFNTNEEDIGLNLTNMATLKIKMSVLFNGRPTVDTPVRIYLKHYEPNIVELAGLKSNQIEFDVSEHPNGIEIPLTSLQVADWWRRENNIGVEHGYADISNIHYISIASASEAPVGHYLFNIESMEITGKWLSDGVFYRVLLGIWLLSASLYVISGFTRTHVHNRALINENEQLRESNREYIVKASYDSLTGALNRGGSEVMIDDLLASCNRIVILYFDLDHFKSINDKYGHQCGDSVLQDFSRQVHHIKEEGQHFIRWGGEEFLLICENIRAKEGRQIAIDIQHKMATHKWPYNEKITCSMGIAELDKAESFNQAIERADRALYSAKRLGRNRVELAKEMN